MNNEWDKPTREEIMQYAVDAINGAYPPPFPITTEERVRQCLDQLRPEDATLRYDLDCIKRNGAAVIEQRKKELGL